MQFLACALMYTVFFPDMWNIIKMGAKLDQLSPAEENTYVQGTTVYYWTMVVGQLAAAFSCQTFRQSLLSYGAPNRVLNWFIVFEVVLALALIYVKPLSLAIGTVELEVWQVLLPFAIGFIPMMLVEEVRKMLVRGDITFFGLYKHDLWTGREDSASNTASKSSNKVRGTRRPLLSKGGSGAKVIVDGSSSGGRCLRSQRSLEGVKTYAETGKFGGAALETGVRLFASRFKVCI